MRMKEAAALIRAIEIQGGPFQIITIPTMPTGQGIEIKHTATFEKWGFQSICGFFEEAEDIGFDPDSIRREYEKRVAKLDAEKI